jgi:hypothetical protein
MKRFRRWLFNGVAALSLLLCAATIFLWVIGYISGFSLNRAGNSISYNLVCSRGELSASRVKWGSPVPMANAGWNLTFMKPASLLDSDQRLTGIIGYFRFRVFGFAFFSLHIPNVMDGAQVLCPCWALALLTAIPPAMWIRQHRRLKPGFCAVCGYDLRATPQRCPECGMATTKAENSK